jgi:hypothetical protein
MSLDEIMESDFMKGGIYKIPDFLPNNIRACPPTDSFLNSCKYKSNAITVSKAFFAPFLYPRIDQTVVIYREEASMGRITGWAEMASAQRVRGTTATRASEWITNSTRRRTSIYAPLAAGLAGSTLGPGCVGRAIVSTGQADRAGSNISSH